MRIAAIDCGTNSIRLLIAEREEGSTRLRQLLRRMEVVGLGQGVDARGEFAPQALERTFAATRGFKQLLDEYAVEQIRFGATSASRDAKNRDLFIAGIEEILGVKPEVISGQEEAQLSFAGAISALEPIDGSSMLVDLGGGSTEFVLGQQQVQAAYSADIGCVRLSERCAVSAPLTAQQGQQIRDEVEQALSQVRQMVDFSKVDRLVGVAGTITTVCAQALALDSYDPEAINGAELSLEQVQRAAEQLANMSAQERAALGFMHPGRVDVIGTGACIWSQIVTEVNAATGGAIKTVRVSEFDILDGLALSLAL